MILRFILCIILFSSEPISNDSYRFFIIWNVGQGQWATAVEDKACLHFDMGGEFWNKKNLLKECSSKANIIYLSHWDWDHIGLIKKARYVLPQMCLTMSPLGKSSPYKARLIDSIPTCDSSLKNKVLRIYPTKRLIKNENDRSFVFVYKERFLIPGDSTQKMEKTWINKIDNLRKKQLRWILLGHHGSKTSSSHALLSLMKFKQSFTSAREKVYGHPHPITLNKLKQYKISNLKTEDWGNIRIYLD